MGLKDTDDVPIEFEEPVIQGMDRNGDNETDDLGESENSAPTLEMDVFPVSRQEKLVPDLSSPSQEPTPPPSTIEPGARRNRRFSLSTGTGQHPLEEDDFEPTPMPRQRKVDPADLLRFKSAPMAEPERIVAPKNKRRQNLWRLVLALVLVALVVAGIVVFLQYQEEEFLEELNSKPEMIESGKHQVLEKASIGDDKKIRDR